MALKDPNDIKYHTCLRPKNEGLLESELTGFLYILEVRTEDLL